MFRKKLAYLRNGRNYTWWGYLCGFIVFGILKYWSLKLIFDKTQVVTGYFNITAVRGNILKSRSKIPDSDFPRCYRFCFRESTRF